MVVNRQLQVNFGTHHRIRIVDGNKSFGEWVRVTRESEGLKQDELAHRMGIARSYLSRIETGERPATEPFCIALSKALGMPWDYALHKAGFIQEHEVDREPEDEAIWEFRRLIGGITDPAEKEQALDYVWSILRAAAKRSKAGAPRIEDAPNGAPGKKARRPAAG